MRHPLRAAASAASSLGLGFAFLALTASFPSAAQAPAAALSGLVSSAEEAAMEGVLVSATAANSNITVTVVSGADGRYAFPANRLGPGRYTIAVRAVGYQLDRPRDNQIELEAGEAPDRQAATKDLRLDKTNDLAAQL